MVNLNLPYRIISKFLGSEEDITNLKYILREINPNQKIDILFDRERLEKLFLELNPQEFLNQNFIKQILDSTYGTKRCTRFLETRKISDEEIKKQPKEKIITKASKFKWGPNEDTKNFVEIFDLDKSTIPTAELVDENTESFPPSHEPYQSLFDYQTEIFFKSKSLLKKQNQRFIIQLPTGGGKTKLAMELVTDFLNQEDDTTVVWLADRKELCMQAIDAFESIWKHRGRKTVTVNRAWDNLQIQSKIRGSKLIVSTISKILQLQKKGNVSLPAELVVFDEAHHASAAKYSKSILFLSIPGTRVIGLTATPGRSLKNQNENEKLAQLFDEKILQIEIPSENIGVIEYLQKKGVLSKANKQPPIEIAKFAKLFSKKEIESISKSSDYSKSSLDKLGSIHLRNIKIAKRLLEIAKSKKQVLYFGTSLAQSRLMFSVLKASGYSAAHIESETPKQFRKDIIKKFRDKQIQFLCNYEVLATGFDSPAVDVVFIARPTKSPILLLQMIGRGMRGPAVNGTKKFDVYYVKDAILDQFADLDTIFELFNEYYTEKDE